MLRPDVQLTEGTVDIVIKSQERESSRQVYFKSELGHVSAMRGEEKVEWNTPCLLGSTRDSTSEESCVRRSRIIISLCRYFDEWSVGCYRDKVADGPWPYFSKVNTLFDFQSNGEEQSLAGISRGQCRVDKFPERGATKITTSLSIEDLRWTIGDREIWKDHLVAADFDTSWVEKQATISLETAGLKVESGSDSLVVVLANECQCARDWRNTLWLNGSNEGEGDHASFDCRMSGNLATWQQRIFGLSTAGGFQPKWSRVPVAGNLKVAGRLILLVSNFR